MNYYECHVTMIGDPIIIEDAVKTEKWKFSKIDGDPVLGAGIKCYATRQFPGTKNVNWVIDVLKETARHLKDYKSVTVLREKVELVVYDTNKSVALTKTAQSARRPNDCVSKMLW